MKEEELLALNKELSALLVKYNCTLEVGHTIQAVPIKKMEENVQEAPIEEVVAEKTEETTD